MPGRNHLSAFIAGAVIVSAMLSGFVRPSEAVASDPPPNVIIFLMDDMGYGDIKALNPVGGGIPTPNLDRFVKEGVCFSHAHSSASVCAPSRYSLLTGNHCYRGLRPMGTWGMFCKSQIKPGQRTLADVLKANGYSTAFFGKLHLGGQFQKPDGSPARNFSEADLAKRFTDGPIDHGFEYSLTLPAGIQASPYAFFENDRLSRWIQREGCFRHFEQDRQARAHFSPARIGKDDNAYKMDNWTWPSVGPLLMNRALNYIDQHSEQFGDSKPFFIHYCSQAGHAPYSPPAAFNIADPLRTWDISAEGAIPIRGQAVSRRTDMICEGDVALGLFVDKLREKGLLDNTLIVFTSDNGVARGKNFRWDNPIHHSRRDGDYGGNRIEFNSNHPDLKHVNGQGVSSGGAALRGRKGQVYEGGHRIPLLIRWSGRIPQGRKVEHQLIGLHDLFRTIAVLTGSETAAGDGLDSHDFSGVLLAPDSDHHPVRQRLHIQSNRPPELAPRNSRRITWATYYFDASQPDRHQLWKAVIATGRNPVRAADSSRPVELFDLTSDPGETSPVDRRGMLRQLHKWFVEDLSRKRTAPIGDRDR